MDDETARIRDHLAAVGMLHDDIDPDRSRFWVAERTSSGADPDSIVGIVRLELDTPNALVGSLYVAPEHRVTVSAGHSLSTSNRMRGRGSTKSTIATELL